MRAIEAKCYHLRIDHPHPGSMPSHRRGFAPSAHQIEWLRTHAPGETAASLAKHFSERFAESVSDNQIRRIAKENRIRTGRTAYPFTPEEDAWIERHCAYFGRAELTEAFNARFRARLAEHALAKRCTALGIRPLHRGPNRYEYSVPEIEWLRAHAPGCDLEALHRGFADAFARTPSADSIWRQCRRHAIAIGTAPLPWKRRAHEARWLAENAPHHTADVLTERFNAEFGRTLIVATVADRCKRLGVRCDERYHRYTEEEVQWLKDHTTGLAQGEAARAFNARFATRVKPGTLHLKRIAIGAKARKKVVRRTTPRYKTKAKTPHRRWTRESVADVVTLYDTGMPFAHIARILSLTAKQVDRAVEAAIRFGLAAPRRRVPCRWSERELADAARAYARHGKAQPVAQTLGIDSSRLGHVLALASAAPPPSRPTSS